MPGLPVQLETKVREDFTITEKALLEHYAKWAPEQEVDVKLGHQHKDNTGWAVLLEKILKAT